MKSFIQVHYIMSTEWIHSIAHEAFVVLELGIHLKPTVVTHAQIHY